MDFTSYQAEAERFSTVRKGLDAEEVAAFQARAARSLRTYERELNFASQRIRELEGKVATIDGRVAQSELAFLHAADARQDLLARARKEADQIGEEAEQLRAEAAEFRDRLASDRRHALEMTEAQRSALLAEAQSRLDQAEVVKNEADLAQETAARAHEELASRRTEIEDELAATRAHAEQEATSIVAAARERAESLTFAARGRAVEDEVAAARERDIATADGDELLAASRAIALVVMEDAKGQSDQMLEAAALQIAAAEDEATRRWSQLETERAGEIRALESRLDALRAVISDTESRFRSVTASSLQELATVGETTARPSTETAEPDVPVVVELEGPDIVIDLTADAATPPPDALFDRRAAKSISAPDETDDDESLSRDIDEARRRPGFYQRRLAGLRERIERYDD